MGKAIVVFDSGQRSAYQQNVGPLQRRLKRNGKVNWLICLLILMLSALVGVVVGFILLPTILGAFVGLLGGSIVGVGLLIAYYFIRSSALTKTKEGIESGSSACVKAYRKAYAIPDNARECTVLASDFLAPTYYYCPSLVFARDGGAISVISKDFEHERNELRYSETTIIGYALLCDSSVLVQSEDGYVLLSSEAKDLFLDSKLPLLTANLNLFVEITKNRISATQRKKDPVFANDTDENSYWKTAENILANYAAKEGE